MKNKSLLHVCHAYAKINLFLRVVDRIGFYHKLDTIMTKIDIQDDIYIRKSSYFSLETRGLFSHFQGENIVYRAYYLLVSFVRRPLLCHIKLQKNIPFGAGLGGGSSDAACAIKKIKSIFQIPQDLISIACALGSDVPFFLLNSTSARLYGVNYELTPIKLSSLWAVLIYPNISLSSKEVFSMYSHDSNFSQPSFVPWEKLDQSSFFHALRNEKNDLTKAAILACPVLSKILNILHNIANFYGGIARLSGSGTTCFVLLKKRYDMQVVLSIIQREFPNYWVVGCKVGW